MIAWPWVLGIALAAVLIGIVIGAAAVVLAALKDESRDGGQHDG